MGRGGGGGRGGSFGGGGFRSSGGSFGGGSKSSGSSSKSSGGGIKSWFSSKDDKPKAKPVASTPKPKPVAPPPPPPAPVVQPASGRGGIGSAFTEGIGFGAGSEVGHRAVEAVVGPRVYRHETVVSETPPLACSNQANSFQVCLSSYETDISRCQMYMDLLCECRRSVGSTATGLNA